jgi:hypothetical protein
MKPVSTSTHPAEIVARILAVILVLSLVVYLFPLFVVLVGVLFMACPVLFFAWVLRR